MASVSRVVSVIRRLCTPYGVWSTESRCPTLIPDIYGYQLLEGNRGRVYSVLVHDLCGLLNYSFPYDRGVRESVTLRMEASCDGRAGQG